MGEAELRGIDLRTLEGERFTRSAHKRMLSTHELIVQRFYGHAERRMLSKVEVALLIAQARVDAEAAAKRERQERAKRLRVAAKAKRKKFEPSARQMEIAMAVMAGKKVA